MRNMTARKLEDPFTTKGVLQRLLAGSTLCADERALTP